jgi:hypothetical protein
MLYESPNRLLSRTLSIINIPLTILGVYGFCEFSNWAISGDYDAIMSAILVIMAGTGLWLEYRYHTIAVSNFYKNREKITWIVSMIMSTPFVIYSLCLDIFGYLDFRETLYALSLFLYSGGFLTCSIIALRKLNRYAPIDTEIIIDDSLLSE